MIRHFLVLILLSILLVFAAHYAQIALHGLLAAHAWIANSLKNIFSGGTAGELLRKLIAMIVIPVAVSLLISLFYWAIKRQWLSNFILLVWVFWLIQTTALLALHI